MTPIIKAEAQDKILTSEITFNHIVVAIIDKSPTILSKGYKEASEQLSFKCISNATEIITMGNGYSFGEIDTIKGMVEYALNVKQANIAVFENTDWKQALQWLIDNAE